MTTVRGPTAAVIEERRPVSLESLYLIGDRTAERLHLLPTLVDGRPNPEAHRLDSEAVRGVRGPRRTQARRKLYTPARLEVLDRLEEASMLPAITFIFSRNGCDEAARSVTAAGVRLTTGAERDRIREIVDEHVAALDERDLAVLGYGPFLAGLEAGVAAHHAGMIPPFKEAVEACFTEGLVKMVYATETLAVGINMPARTVVIEKLSKFTGDHHEFLTPGDYTQLTGRAGRRGIDERGFAIVLWSPFVPFDQVSALASSRSYQLSSAFRPTYNMTANLVRSYTQDEAHHLLNLSFAQYQADRHVVRMEARLERREAQLAELRELARSPFGDLDEYRRLREGTSPPPRNADAIELALMRVRPGDILYVEPRAAGRTGGRADLQPAQGRHEAPGADPERDLGAADRTGLQRRAPRARPHRPAHAVRAQPGAVPAAGGPPAVEGDGGRRDAPPVPPARRTATTAASTTRSPRTRCCGSGCAPPPRPSARRARSTTCASASRVAASPCPTASTACCASSRRGGTSTAGS